MKLHYESVSSSLLSSLQKMMSSEVLADFRLVGGTALSLQRGHRRSIDIDLFTDVEYGNMPLGKIRNFIEKAFPMHQGTETLEESALGYHLWVSDGDSPLIKVDLFYTDPFIYQPICQDGIRMADEREIAAMKLLAISGPIKRQKDYWDIHELLQDYTFEEMVQWGLKRHPYSLTIEDIIEGFKRIDDIEESPEGIDSMKSMDFWELKVMDLKQTIKDYIRINKL